MTEAKGALAASEKDDDDDQGKEECQRVSSKMDLFSVDTLRAGKLYCVRCRQTLASLSDTEVTEEKTREDPPPPPPLRCSRCAVVHYCSRACQKANFPLHKGRCKKIHKLRQSIDRHAAGGSFDPACAAERNNSNNNDGGVANSTNDQRYELALSIVDLAYLSTDTIDRGKRIYHAALLEYHNLLKLDFGYDGALESFLILLSILGHDASVQGWIDSALCLLEDKRRPGGEPIRFADLETGNDGDRLWARAQGFDPETSERPDPPLRNDPSRVVSLLGGTQWNANSFLVPLFFSSLKLQAKAQREEPSSCDTATREHLIGRSTALGREIERCSGSRLPVLRALCVDSVQRWGLQEAADLWGSHRRRDTPDHNHRLGGASNYKWNHGGCLLFWEILRDAVAFTPGLGNALEDTIGATETLAGVAAVEERPLDLGDNRFAGGWG